MKTKNKTLEELKTIVADLKQHGKRVVFANGCFRSATIVFSSSSVLFFVFIK